MCRYTPNQLCELESNLRKIRAIGDLMALHDRESGLCFPDDSMVEIGYLLKDWTQQSLEIFEGDPPSAEAQGGE